MISLKKCSILLCAIGAAGCSSLIDVRSDEQSLSKNSVSFTDASTRGIYVFDRDPANVDFRICVEPSPDALVDVEESVAASVTASGGGGGATSVAPSLEKSSKRDSDTLERQVAISAFRDIVSQACMAHAQGIISDKSYANFLRASIASMVAVLAIDTMGDSFKPGEGATYEQAQLMSDMAQLAMVSTLMTDEQYESRMNELFIRLFETRVDMIKKVGEAQARMLAH